MNKLEKEKNKYIILELIPDKMDSRTGNIIQLSALKLEGLKLISRFDYRLDENKVTNEDLKNMTSYDKENFNYVSTSKQIKDEFKKWAQDLPILLIDDTYTMDYLKEINNEKKLVYPYLNLEYKEDVFTKIMEKYPIEPSNYLTDIIYEALIYESNNK